MARRFDRTFAARLHAVVLQLLQFRIFYRAPAKRAAALYPLIKGGPGVAQAALLPAAPQRLLDTREGPPLEAPP